jgi:hypothetical protein
VRRGADASRFWTVFASLARRSREESGRDDDDADEEDVTARAMRWLPARPAAVERGREDCGAACLRSHGGRWRPDRAVRDAAADPDRTVDARAAKEEDEEDDGGCPDAPVKSVEP